MLLEDRSRSGRACRRRPVDGHNLPWPDAAPFSSHHRTSEPKDTIRSVPPAATRRPWRFPVTLSLKLLDPDSVSITVLESNGDPIDWNWRPALGRDWTSRSHDNREGENLRRVFTLLSPRPQREERPSGAREVGWNARGGDDRPFAALHWMRRERATLQRADEFFRTGWGAVIWVHYHLKILYMVKIICHSSNKM